MSKIASAGIAGVCGFLALLSESAHAQPAAPSPPPEQTAQNAATPADQGAPEASAATAGSAQPATIGQLAEVVVTAQVRQQAAQSIPISMSVVTGDELTANNVINMASMQATTPDFSVNAQGSNSAQINIRGIGINALQAGITPGVAILRDGLLEDEAVGASVTGNFYDLQSVSVLKGPQGTFIGASAIGGAVEINSRDPQFGSAVSGYSDLQIGNYSDNKFTGAINAPVSDTFATRLAYNYETQGSFALDLGGLPGANTPYPVGGTTTDNSSDPGHIDNRNLRLGLLWKPTDHFQALLKLEYNRMSFGGLDEQINPATFVNPITLAVSHEPFYNQTLHLGPWVYDQYLPQQKFLTIMHFNMLQLNFTLPQDIVLRSVSGFQQSVQNSFVAEVPPAYVNTGYTETTIEPDNYYSQELDLISPTTWPVNFVTGASWFMRITPVTGFQLNEQTSTTFPQYVSSPSPRTSAVRVMGLYANVNWQLSQTLQLQVGARENWDNNYNYGLNEVINTQRNTTTFQYNIGHFKDNATTGKLGLNWTPSQGQLFYIFAARGYKAGALSTGGPTPVNVPTAAPEYDWDYEAGWKGLAFNRHVQTDVGLFYTNYQAMQEQVYNPTIGANQLVNLTSSSKIYGVEVEFDGRFGGVIADLSGDYLHSALGSLRAINSAYLPSSAANQAQCQPGQAPPACFDYNVVGPTGRGYYETVGGEENVLSPKYTINGTLGYQFRFGDKSLTAEVNDAYVASQYDSIFQENNIFYMPAHALFGANLTFDAGPWEVAAYGKNLFNKLYIEGINGNYVFYGAPRQYGLRVQRSF